MCVHARVHICGVTAELLRLKPMPLLRARELVLVRDRDYLPGTQPHRHLLSCFLAFSTVRLLQAGQLLDRHFTRAASLPTPLSKLNLALRGGVPCGAVTEVVGPAGVGKTQLCFTLALTALLSSAGEEEAADATAPGAPTGGVIVVDTEGTFDPRRLAGMAAAALPGIYDAAHAGSAAADAALDRLLSAVLVFREDTSDGVVKRLESLEDVILSSPWPAGVRLLLVDSVAAPARGGAPTDKDRDESWKRTELLARQASALKTLAHTFNLPVVVTNQITGGTRRGGGGGTAGFGAASTADGTSDAVHIAATAAAAAATGAVDDELMPALGNTWSHAVNTRLYLSPHPAHSWGGIAAATGAEAGDIGAGALAVASASTAGAGAGLLTIIKSPCAPNITVPYVIGKHGVEPYPDVTADAAAAAAAAAAVAAPGK